MIPKYRSNWSANEFYDTGDLVMSDGGQQLYSLTKDTSGGSYRSNTPPENDTANWTSVLDFPSTTTAQWISAIVGIFGGIVGAGGFTLSVLNRIKPPGIEEAVGKVIAGSKPITDLQGRLSDLQREMENTVDVLADKFQEISQGMPKKPHH
jgi:hypothetical protein